MTRNGFLTPVEALEFLGLYNPEGKVKPNTDYLTRLHKRGLLKRTVLGPKTLRYRKADCEKLLQRAEIEGLMLTEKVS